MSEATPMRIRAGCGQPALGKRSGAVEFLVQAAYEKRQVILDAEHGSGASEVLSHTFDRLFFSERSITPFYFSIPRDADPEQVASRFLDSLLLHILAFRSNDTKLLFAGLTQKEILRKVPAEDRASMYGLVEYFGSRTDGETAGSFLERVAKAPIRAAAAGFDIFCLVDSEAGADEGVSRAISETLIEGERPFVIAARSPYAPVIRRGDCSILRHPLQRLSPADASAAAAEIAVRRGVTMNEATLDLLVLKFGSDLSKIDRFISLARDRNVPLADFRDLFRHYVFELVHGRFAREFHQLLMRAFPTGSGRTAFCRFVRTAIVDGRRAFTASDLAGHLAVNEAEAAAALRGFIEAGLLSESFGMFSFAEPGEFGYDLLRLNMEALVSGEPRALVAAHGVVDLGSRAAGILEQHYIAGDAIGINDIFKAFDGRKVPRIFFDEADFAARFAGVASDDVIAEIAAQAVADAGALYDLPNIYTSAFTADLYPPILQLIERPRSAVGVGFQGACTEDSVVAWFAAEVGSKLALSLSEAEFWCDRLEMAAVMTGFAKLRIWLIARNGFDDEARDFLKQRGVLSSSREQAALLKRYLYGSPVPALSDLDQFEVTLSMDDRSELAAARMVEDLARKHNFDAKSINQIKTAVIEAFINAAEHSLSPDRKVRQRISVDENGLTVTISNRGIRLDKSKHAERVAAERRGWGLELIRRLMDEVVVHETDDGASISMTKHLVRAAAA